jgi:ribosomal protein L27
VGIGSDDTLFAKAEGRVVYSVGKVGRVVSIVTE